MQQQTPGLGHDQHLAIGVVEKTIRHRRVRHIDVNPNARVCVRVAVAGHCNQAVDKVGSLGGDGNRHPAQLIGRSWHFIERCAAQFSLRDGREGLVRHRRAKAIKPRPAIGHARRGEWSSGQLLRVKTMRYFLGRILPLRQCARNGFAGEFISKSRLVTHTGCLVRIGRRF